MSGVTVELKFISPAVSKLTGKVLLGSLAIALFLSALTLDNLSISKLSFTLPLSVCAATAAVLGYSVIPLLQKLKAGQVIREDGPQAHLKKSGTPTMGGVFFVPVAVLISLWWAYLTGVITGATIAVSLLTLTYAGIGWLDDWLILRKKSNKGISPRAKLACQVGAALAFCLWLGVAQPQEFRNVQLPLGLVLPLGWLFLPVAGFTLVAESNATNLTDGVDGLAAGTSAIAFLALAVLVSPNHADLALFCTCFSGSCLGFLVHNRNKAKVFMGDTGSLALGGALGAVGVYTGQLWALFILSGLFFVESLSVIAQVSYYKATKNAAGVGRRLFKMAPLHHHLELSGWSETRVVGAFYLISAALAAVAIVTNF